MKRICRINKYHRLFILLGLSLLIFNTGPGLADIYVDSDLLTFYWTASTGPVDHYNVYLSVDSSPFFLYAEVNGTLFQFTPEDGKKYRVLVEAEDQQGNVSPLSDPSETVVVLMDGSVSDSDGDGMTDSWEIANLLDPNNPADSTADPDRDGLTNIEESETGTLPQDPDSDHDGVFDLDEIQNRQNPLDPADNLPVADAGEDQTLTPTLVTLDGSASFDPNQDTLSYLWRQTAGKKKAKLSNPRAQSPTFLGKKTGLYRFQLIVNDGKQESLPVETTVTIQNTPPNADAGSDKVATTRTFVGLNGKSSNDSNEDALTYSWKQTAGPSVFLFGARMGVPFFWAPSSGVYTFELVVSDGSLESLPDEVNIIVNGEKRVPTADAGPDQSVSVSESVTLDGSQSSDPDGEPLTYAWKQVEGPRAVTLEASATENPRFIASRAGIYRFELTVDDGIHQSLPDDVTISVESGNQIPVAVIQDIAPAPVGQWVSLNGSASYDADQDPLIYYWSQEFGPQVLLENDSAAITGFYTVTEGILRFKLIVDDGELTSRSTIVEIIVSNDNLAPHSDAGSNISGFLGQNVCLSGANSYDPNPEDSLSYSWSQTGGPPAALLGPETASPCFIPLAPGEYEYSLVTYDGQNYSTPSTVKVTISPAPLVIPSNQKKSSSGCAIAQETSPGTKIDKSDLVFVLTLFLPAMAAIISQKRRYRLF